MQLSNQPAQNPKGIESAEMQRRTFLAAGITSFISLVHGRIGGIEARADDKADAHEDLEKLIDKEFHAQDETYERIAEVGMQGYYDELPNKSDLFLSPQEMKEANGVCSCCSDEGIRKYTEKDSDKRMMLIRTPGSGMLKVLTREDKDPFAREFIDATAKEQLELGVTVFTSHIGCGAAKAVFNARVIFLRSNGKEAEANRLLERGSDTWAQDWAQAVSKRMREMGKEQSIKHADSIHADFIDHLDRPKSIHNARGLDLVDKYPFNADAFTVKPKKGLPPAFVEHAGTADKESITDVQALSSIAFSDHGFGRKFSAERSKQFLLTAIAENQQRVNVLMARLEKAKQGFPEENRNKVRVEGIVTA